MKNGISIGQQAEDSGIKTITHYNNTAVDDLSALYGKDLYSEVTGNTQIATAHKGNTDFTIYDYEKSKGALGKRTHDLLLMLLVQFSRQNPKGKIDKINAGDNTEKLSLTVNIPLKQYLQLIGDNTENEETFKKSIRRNIVNQLAILRSITYVNTEEINGLIVYAEGRGYIKNFKVYTPANYFTVEIDKDFAESLTKYPRYTTRPLDIFKISPRSTTLTNLVNTLYSHASQKKNKGKKTDDRLKVSTILNNNTYPAYDSKTVKHKGWNAAIVDPLESDLNAAKTFGFIIDWGYCHPKGKPLTDEEGYSLYDNYTTWSNTLIYFILPKEEQTDFDLLGWS